MHHAHVVVAVHLPCPEHWHGGWGTDPPRVVLPQVRNARTAMLAILGFWVQAWVTGKGPLQNAVDHLHDPFGANGMALLECRLGSSSCCVMQGPVLRTGCTSARCNSISAVQPVTCVTSFCCTP